MEIIENLGKLWENDGKVLKLSENVQQQERKLELVPWGTNLLFG